MMKFVQRFLVSGALLAAPIATSLPAAGSVPAPSDADPMTEGIVARVNGEAIYLEDLERRLQDLHSEVSPTQRSAPDLSQLMYGLINDALLAQEARALGLHEEDPIPSEVDDLRRDLAVKRLRREEVGKRIEVTEDKIREAFEREYRKVTLRVLTTREKERSEQALADLREGADFAELAEERSIDPYKHKGGLVEALPKIDLMTEIAAEAFTAEPGELIGPIRTPIGWAVVRVEAFHEADPERLEEVRGDVEQMIRYRQASRLEEDLARSLRDEHSVEIVDEAVAAVAPERIEDGRLIPKVPDPTAVVAHVGDGAIHASEYADALKWRWKGVSNEAAARASAPIVLESMVQDRLLLAEALERGYGEAPAVERAVRASEKQLVLKRYLREVLGPTVEVSREEMEEYYAAHQDRFRRPPRFHMSQITVESEEEAERIAGLLREGTDMAWLAERHSVDSYAEAGGDRGWVTPSPGDGGLNDQVLGSAVGDVIGPFEVRGDWLVLQVDAREEQGPYPFDRVSGNVRSEVFQRKFQERLDEVLKKLRSRSEIEVYDRVVDTLRILGTREETAEAGHAH